jgi:radical SAM-linked protein
MKRLRVIFTKERELKYISHLDLMRAWERLLRRARVPLAYSKGFNPHPKIAVAMPLPVGITGGAELLDIFLEADLTPDQFRAMVEPQLPPGLRVLDVTDTALSESALQSRLIFAEYRVELDPSLDPKEVGARISSFLAAERIDRTRRRHPEKTAPVQKKGAERTYNLRALVDSIWQEDQEPLHIHMRLRAGISGADGSQGESSGVARPDEVLDALGLSDHISRIHRTGLIIAAPHAKQAP